MTVPSQTNKDQQAGNGVTTVFTVPFRILDQTHLRVLLTDDGVTTEQTLTTHYSVSGVGGASTTVTFVTAPPNGSTVTFLRNVPLTQETDYVPNDPFPAESHEQALDKLTMIAQQHAERIDAAFTLPEEVTGVDTTLPPPEPRTIVGWNDDGDALVNYELDELATEITYGAKLYSEFTGDGVAVDFTLPADPASVNNLRVEIDGVGQRPGADFTVSGTTMTFTGAPADGAVIAVWQDEALPVGAVDVGAIDYTPPSTGVAGTVKTFLDTLDSEGAATLRDDLASTASGKGAALMGWISAAAGAVARTVLRKLYDLPVHLFDFVPLSEQAAILAGTSTYDCTTALTNAIAAAISTSQTSNVVQLPKGLINISSGFLLTRPVMLIGSGSYAPGYSSFPTEPGTKIKYTGADTNAVMFTFRNVNYGGCGMKNLGLDGNGVALRGLILDGVLGFQGEDLHITGCTNALLGLISTGETTSWDQFKNIFLEGELHGGVNSTCLWLSGGDGSGGSGSNACHCTFENLHINHGGVRHGIVLGGVDNITFLMTYIFRASGGTGYGVKVEHDQQGADWFPIANTFYHLQAGAGGWYEPAGGNAAYPTAVIYGYQTDNGQPLPVTNGRRLPYWTNSGDWVGARSIGRTSYGTDWAGSVNANSGTTSTAVTFSAPRSSAAYIVVINSPTTIGYAIQSKTANGFTIAWASALPTTYSVDWLVLGG